MPESNRPVACTLSDSKLQIRRSGLLRVAWRAVQESVELGGGFGFRFPAALFEQPAQVGGLDR